MRVGIFGGSFDPPHIGHFVVAEALIEARGLDLLLLVPAARSPLKPDGPTASGPERLRMLEAAVAGDARFAVSDVELARGEAGEGPSHKKGPSYTVDTLAQVARERPGDSLTLAIGVDQWAQFDRWHRPREVARLAEIAVLTRAGERPGDVAPRFEDGPPPPFVEVPVPRIDVSSTEIRRRVREGLPFRYLVPEAVRRILEAEKLYL